MTIDRQQTAPHKSKLFCFGFGYVAGTLARQLDTAAFEVAGTNRAVEAGVPGAVALTSFNGAEHGAGVADLLAGATHVLVSVPPGADGDLVLRHHADDLAQLVTLKWIGYLSTIGVYGDADGDWIDETCMIQPKSERGRRRAAAEAEWRAFGKLHGKRVEIFRLPGIYGPGRSALDAVKAGTARRIVKQGQVFNRIHVADIAAVLARAMTLAAQGRAVPFDTYNVVDDEPGSPQDVVAYAADLLQMPAPPEQPFETADLSPMARSFYGESKRVRNDRMKAAFGISLQYPTYREGLRAIAAAE